MDLEIFFKDKGLAESSQRHYKASVKMYERLHLLTLPELLEEADLEEEKGIRWKNRKLKQRLVDFRNYVYSYKKEGTAKQYMTDIKAIYRHFEIEIQPLPSFNPKNIDKTYEITFDDLPTRQELIDSYYEANNVTKCILTFAMSSGFSKVDMLNLTVGDFIKACSNYISNESLLQQLKELKNQSNVIPTFIGERQKTNKRFITFCSPESVQHICQYLIGRDAELRQDGKELSYDDVLFKVSGTQLANNLRKINTKLKLGLAGNTTRLRCHMLRKFQASTLFNCEKVSWTVAEIDTLQGRSMDQTHRAYFHNDSKKLWAKYEKSVDDLMLFQSIHEIDKAAYENLEKENRFYKNEISKNEKKLEEQERTINEIKSMQEKLEALVGL